MLEGEAESLTRKAIDRALEGDAAALRLCIERIIPPRRERAIRFALPALVKASDAAAGMAAIAAAVASGEITASEGAALSALVGAFAKSLETGDLEMRIVALEKRTSQNGK
jgi:hypothetical protein